MNTIPNSNPGSDTTIELTTPCAALCPHSGEPQAGSTLTIRYRPAAVLLELHAPAQWLQAQAAGDEPTDLETLAQKAAHDATAALGVAVEVEARYLLRGGLGMWVCVRS
jgi:NADPH-dependent 7-cyano-7-deazaguanine reductase QueF